MAANLKDIKKKSNSIQATRTITNAMSKVAYAGLRKSKLQLSPALLYQKTAHHILEVLFARFPIRMNVISHLSDQSTNTLHIVITTNRGMCGALNIKLIKFAEQFSKPEDHFFIIGRKGLDVFRNSQLIGSFVNHNRGLPLYKEAEEITQQLITLVKEHQYQNIVVHYNAYISTLVQKPSSINLFQYVQDINAIDMRLDLEEVDNETLQFLFYNTVAGKIYGIMMENFVSEQAARIVAMESATKNADELIAHLNLVYNKLRQEKITNQIIEIVNGANALT